MIVAESRVLNSLMDGRHTHILIQHLAPPTITGKNSLRGFEYELAFLKKYTDREFPVYITETGWVDSKTQRWLPQYYQYAVDHICLIRAFAPLHRLY